MIKSRFPVFIIFIMTSHHVRWLAVCLIPLILLIWFIIFPAANPRDHLINGIIMACAAVFLFKMVLFAYIGSHLRQDRTAKKHALLQMLPPVLFGVYIAYYFIK